MIAPTQPVKKINFLRAGAFPDKLGYWIENAIMVKEFVKRFDCEMTINYQILNSIVYRNMRIWSTSSKFVSD